ncbi:serine/threonine-protein kinase [Streptomyces longispororuber]|uniref:serine/threonine-protein kinase n=1 Tax=Streptomyces longispororuber TaxID=68230 RepID=UPI00340E2F8D
MHEATDAFRPLQADDPPVVAGYRLAARLGAGGMGRVYLSHTRGGRPVAIKVVRPELADDPGFRRRFRREVEAARRVRGAYTAELVDADADGTPPWLTTLYVPGPSLTQAVARRGPLPVPAVLWLMAGVAEALEAIHGAGIVHRDLKPSNVLLAADGPRVIDFGISLAAEFSSYTATGSAVGTPQFMAPEQASGGEVTAATDIFALGQTAAFAALGEPLYGEGSAVGVLYRIVHDAPDLSRLPAPLRPLIARCLAAAPTERATPAEVVAWCRQELGRDADAGAGPAVWRDVMGPKVAVPGPLPEPPAAPTALWPTRPAAAGRDGGRARRRRTTLVATAAVTAGLLVLGGLTWRVMEADGSRERRAATSPTAGTGTSGPEASGGTGAAGGAAPTAAAEREQGEGARGSGGPDPATDGSGKPRPLPYPQVWLDAKKSVSFDEPVQRKDRKGDIRFDCEGDNCYLDSRTSLITMLYSKPGADLEACRIALDGADSRRLPLAGVAAGSEICVKHPSGDIALLVVQVKSTALPRGGFSFLTADMTIWRKP